MSKVANAAGLFERARIRIHFGSPLECVYALLSFGLPSGLLPFTPECELKTGNHKKWIQRRIVKERELLRFGVFLGIDLPSRNDVCVVKVHLYNAIQEINDFKNCANSTWTNTTKWIAKVKPMWLGKLSKKFCTLRIHWAESGMGEYKVDFWHVETTRVKVDGG
jgi:hypothetical protein